MAQEKARKQGRKREWLISSPESIEAAATMDALGPTALAGATGTLAGSVLAGTGSMLYESRTGKKAPSWLVPAGGVLGAGAGLMSSYGPLRRRALEEYKSLAPIDREARARAGFVGDVAGVMGARIGSSLVPTPVGKLFAGQALFGGGQMLGRSAAQPVIKWGLKRGVKKAREEKEMNEKQASTVRAAAIAGARQLSNARNASSSVGNLTGQKPGIFGSMMDKVDSWAKKKWGHLPPPVPGVKIGSARQMTPLEASRYLDSSLEDLVTDHAPPSYGRFSPGDLPDLTAAARSQLEDERAQLSDSYEHIKQHPIRARIPGALLGGASGALLGGMAGASTGGLRSGVAGALLGGAGGTALGALLTPGENYRKGLVDKHDSAMSALQGEELDRVMQSRMDAFNRGRDHYDARDIAESGAARINNVNKVNTGSSRGMYGGYDDDDDFYNDRYKYGSAPLPSALEIGHLMGVTLARLGA